LRLAATKRKCRLGEANGENLKYRKLKSEKANRTCNAGSPFVVIRFLSEANHLPAAAGASLRVSFMPDPRVNHPPT
jgi:hypothetical protein